MQLPYSETTVGYSFLYVAIGNLVELFGHTNKPIDTANQGFPFTK